MDSKQLTEAEPDLRTVYYDTEENIYIQINGTVICEESDINPGNNQVPSKSVLCF